MNRFLDKIRCSLKCLFIFSRKKRDKIKNIYVKKLLKKLKFGVTYSVWDGEELLEASIKSIRGEVDYINVVYQELSWMGNRCSENLLPLLLDLKERGLIDEIIEYKPNFQISVSQNERNKRNLGLKYLKKEKCDYFMPMDVDEFYIKKELRKAKEIIVKNGLTHTFCPYCEYWIKPTLKVVLDTHYCYVTFFAKMTLLSSFSKYNSKRPCLVDPTRSPSHFLGAKYYVMENLVMHHMSCVRKDIMKKFNNTSGDMKEGEKYNKDINDLIKEKLDKKEITPIENIFNVEFQ